MTSVLGPDAGRGELGADRYREIEHDGELQHRRQRHPSLAERQRRKHTERQYLSDSPAGRPRSCCTIPRASALRGDPPSAMSRQEPRQLNIINFITHRRSWVFSQSTLGMNARKMCQESGISAQTTSRKDACSQTNLHSTKIRGD